ncbi:acetolactate synthase large subunit [Streptomyces ipomoeae]|jgi:acetolactate synthase-1/2/3 large subunit|uniref:Thiamine pyrophosphate enzyme, C-terminal TPP binding domain protein n=2 Tax=Streptomyces ipomoeae TaxID=103232 RepID=L1KIS4_9ACTN|nr:acetolactate synthase large subunit [Streptomyces ipomoeae]EKX60375.1 thiamine pyrophosphate enzyme, C-terminal TPP binding domain protein [Streptomyces ipomoeae 91-03]MDX2693235.1 acetolactate synthase large subunit [Streptomyces ipomoeae]MDX2822684.1 acetolactate synthase large subunit [Streptomyces ipomoeae]MDX2838872.1 acetolactate synthase large subunit [Streptomyces ipomoeae]MDX2875314.1 acetolactate synthase large subunit [Streptomyces ipomoeae]
MTESAAGMTGARALVETAAAGGVQVCFANPGTTEMPLVSALDEVPSVHPVLGLFEGVCTGAADGYARISGRPAMTLLHLGPGFANGIANLHNARRAHSPVLNVVGDHASWHLPYDAPLTSDIVSLATPVSGWVGTVGSAARTSEVTAEALAAARTPPGHGATLIVPADFQQATVTGPIASMPTPPAPTLVDAERVERIAERLRGGSRAVLLLGGGALNERGQRAARRISEATGATLYSETFPAAAERGRGLPDLDRLPYFPEAAIKALAGAETVVLAGALEPVAYFGYAGTPSLLAEPGTVHALAEPGEDGVQALEDLAKALGAKAASPLREPAFPDGLPDGPLIPAAIGRIVSALLPEGAVVSVEGGTCGYPFFTASAHAARHTTLTNTGGAIGQGLPAALGAAIAAPERQVIALQSDGSAQYTIQALWTMAREQTDVITLIASNRRYGILRTELDRHGGSDRGPASAGLTSLDDPALNWPALASGYGVPAQRAETGDELARALRRALAAGGPQLIEMVL